MRKNDMLKPYVGGRVGLETVEGKVYLAIFRDYDGDFLRLNPALAHYRFLGSEVRSFNEAEAMFKEFPRGRSDLEVILNKSQVKHLMSYETLKEQRERYNR